jgi:hypothetical protein
MGRVQVVDTRQQALARTQLHWPCSIGSCLAWLTTHVHHVLLPFTAGLLCAHGAGAAGGAGLDLPENTAGGASKCSHVMSGNHWRHAPQHAQLGAVIKLTDTFIYSCMVLSTISIG